jgi:hypothetical protein
MQMRPEVQIKSMVKAMTDVVLPAIDPANKLAQEQGRLVIGLLSLMAQQLPLQFRYDCDELRRLVGLAAGLKQAAGGAPEARASVEEMNRSAAAAAATLAQALVGPQQLEQAVRDLRQVTSEVVRSVAAAKDGQAMRQVQQVVLATSKEQLLRDRSWVLMQGWEPDPAAIPRIETLLAGS